MTKLSSITPLLSQLSSEELRSLNSMVISVLKSKRALESKLVGAQLKVGDMVTCDHPKLAGKSLRVTKISRTKATVRPEGSFSGYNVPMSMLILSK
jgi:hypothetical protein